MHAEQTTTPEPLSTQDIIKIIQNDRARYLRWATVKLLAGMSAVSLSVVSVQSQFGVYDLTCGALPVGAMLYFSAKHDFEYLLQLEQQYVVSKNVPLIQKSVELLEDVAYPEARELQRRSAIIQTIHQRLFPRVAELCLLPAKKRREEWKTLYPILDKVQIFSSTILDKSKDAVNEFGILTTPIERVETLRKRAAEALTIIDRKGHDEEYDEQYRLISNMAKGRVTFSKVTLFDLLQAMRTFHLKLENLA